MGHLVDRSGSLAAPREIRVSALGVGGSSRDERLEEEPPEGEVVVGRTPHERVRLHVDGLSVRADELRRDRSGVAAVLRVAPGIASIVLCHEVLPWAPRLRGLVELVRVLRPRGIQVTT